LDLGPPCLQGNPEDVLREVLVPVLRVRAGYRRERGVLLVEGVGNVLEEDQPEYDVLVFGGVEVAAHLVSGLPELPLEAQVATVRRQLRLRFATELGFLRRLPLSYRRTPSSKDKGTDTFVRRPPKTGVTGGVWSAASRRRS